VLKVSGFRYVPYYYIDDGEFGSRLIKLNFERKKINKYVTHQYKLSVLLRLFSMTIFYPASYIFHAPLYYLIAHFNFILKEIFIMLFSNDPYLRKMSLEAFFTYVESFLPKSNGRNIFNIIANIRFSTDQKVNKKPKGKKLKITEYLVLWNLEEKSSNNFELMRKLLTSVVEIIKDYFMKSVIIEDYYENNTIVLASFIAKKVYLKIDNKYVLISDNKNIFIWLLKLIISIPLAIFLLLVCILVTILKILLIKPFQVGYGLDYKLVLLNK
jgi:hypothetical protein